MDVNTIPAPLSIKPSQLFDGDDGQWSSFTIRVGTPPTDVRVLVSTLVPETWIVLDSGCTENDISNCKNSRGNTFSNTSTTWQDLGHWNLGVDGALGANPQSEGDYGSDILGFELSDSSAVTIDGQIIAGTTDTLFWLGNLGISPRTPLFDDQKQRGLLTSMRDQNLIPSLSYGYTSGASYRSAYGSLTLGGYDSSRFVPNDVTFTLAPQDTHDLVIGLQSISYSVAGSDTEVSLLTYGAGFLAFIDSTLPNLWLPNEVCDAFVQAFGLTYQSIDLLYLVNETMHAANLQANASVTFQLGNDPTANPAVNITFPYASFDLNMTQRTSGSQQRYFPIRNASTSDQYTLGRTFLQEAYLAVNYDNQTFSVSQVDNSGKSSHIVAITNSTTTSAPSSTSSSVGPSGASNGTTAGPGTQSSGLATSAIAGIVIAIVAIAVLIAGGFIFVCLRRRKRRRNQPQRSELPGDSHHQQMATADTTYYHENAYPQKQSGLVDISRKGQELDGGDVASPSTINTNHLPAPTHELSGSEIQRAELHSPEPDRSRSPTLVNRGSTITPEPTWGTRLEMPSPELHSREFADHGNGASHSPSALPSPQTEAPSIRAGSSTSAFQSPVIGYTRFGMTTPPAGEPISPGSGTGVLAPEHERDDSFFTHHHGPSQS